MNEKLRIFHTEVFFESPVLDNHGQKIMQLSVCLPLTAISHLTAIEPGNPRSSYAVHFKLDSLTGFTAKVKSINPVNMAYDLVEVIK